MPKIRHKGTGEVTVVTDQQAADLVRSGRFDLEGGATVEVRGKTGGTLRVGGRQIAADATLTGETAESQADRLRRSRLERDYGSGVMNKLKAIGEGFASGATFGLVDPLLEDEATEARREVLGGYRTVGEVGGILVPAFLSGGASLGGQGAIRGGGGLARAVARYTPAGAVSQWGGQIAARGGAKAAVAGAAFEGAAGNAGYYLSDVALGNRKLSAEGFVAAMGEGALWAGAAGGAFHGLERGFVRARSMFPKLAGRDAGKAAKETVDVAEQEFERQADEVLAAGDDMLAKARERQAQIRAERAELGLAMDRQKLTTRQALDDIKIEKAKAGPQPRPRPAPASAAEPAPPTGAGGWTPEAIDQSGELAAMLGQRPRMADGSGPIDVSGFERAVEEHAQATVDVRQWIAKTRGTAAKQAGGKLMTDSRALTRAEVRELDGGFPGPHRRNIRTKGKVYDELGQEVAGDLPDEYVAWNRPRMTSVEESMEIYEDYNQILRRAAMETSEEARERLVREAAELEMGAFDASPGDWTAKTLAAREKAGMDALTLARRRLNREVETLAKLTPEEAAWRMTGEGPPPTPRVAKMTEADRALAADRAAGDVGGRLGAGLEEAEARFQKWGLRDQMRAVDDATAEGLDALGAVGRDVSQRVGEVERAGLDVFSELGHSPRGRLVNSAEEGIKLLGNLERTNAALVREMGEAAPPAARRMADEYTRAVDDQARKATDRMAQASDDIADAAPVARQGATEAADGHDVGALASKAADIGMVLEMLQTAGVPAPDVDRLPVIGPVLGLWLKVRAARAMVGQLGGRVPATAEAVAASKASRVRDRTASAVDRMLGLGEKVAKRAAAPGALAAPRLAALGHKLFDDGEKREAKTAAEMTKARMDELAAATSDPAAVQRAVRRALRGATDPDLVTAIEEAVIRKLTYLAAHMPKEPPPSLLGRRAWKPSPVEIDRFARRVRAAEDPASVLEDLADGTVTPEAAETLREVYPELYAEAQMRLVERSAEIEDELPYQRVIKLALLFDAPLLPSMRPERIAALQAVGKNRPAPQPRAPSGQVPNLDALFMPAGDRREMRR